MSTWFLTDIFGRTAGLFRGDGNPALAVEQAGAKGVSVKPKTKCNGPGKGKAYVSTSIPLDIDAKLRALADKGGTTRGALARAYIVEGVRSGRYVGRVWQAGDKQT
jgi:hypothetical protein